MICRFGAFLLLSAGGLLADVRVSSLFADHMVLQRDRPLRIWGKADPAEPVTVRFRQQSVATTTDDTGRWSVMLQPEPAGGPHELTVAGRNTIRIGDVLVGDVWVASGQSNMVWRLDQSNHSAQEIAAANYPQIRFYQVQNSTSPVPLDDVKAAWRVCTPQDAGVFSGVGYFFARHLHQKLNVPVAILQSAWGGTPAESWISMTGLASDPALISVYADWAERVENYPVNQSRYEVQLKEWETASARAKAEGRPGPARPAAPAGPTHPHLPSALYNAMIHPLTPYAIRGASLYQGENNATRNRAYVYRRLFPALIQDWRRIWGQGDFPFLFVQLANYAKTNNSQWAELREAQLMTLQLANTGMAVTIDIGEAQDIHPKNKQDVGLRLAFAARAIAYGEKVEYSGPLYRQIAIEGDTARVYFDHAGSGLMAKGGADLTGFEIAGADRRYVPAQARIEGATVVVSSPEVSRPVHVRYAWADNPSCNLYNGDGLPASPFRSEIWLDPMRYR